MLDTARSCLPSPLKSPTAIERGLLHTPKLVAALKLPAPLPNKTDMLSEFWLATAKSCLPSPLKSPTANERGAVPAPKLVAAAKLTGLHVTAGVVTVNMKVFVVVNPRLSNAVTVTVYTPAGCASVTRTTPVVGLPANLPLNLVEVATVRRVVLVGAAEGVMVVFALSCT